MKSTRCLIAVVALAQIGGCASLNPEDSFEPVRNIAKTQLGQNITWSKDSEQRSAVERRIDELLVQPITAETAVQVALLNNRGLQAAYADLQIAQADLVAASRLPNPHFSMLRASKLESGVREFKIEQALTLNIFALVFMPQRIEIERRRMQSTQNMVALEMLRLASESRKAFYNAVAQNQVLQYSRQVADAAQASAQLARRMANVGNFSKLQQAREQSFYADAMLNVGRAEQAAISAREHLARTLGLAAGVALLKLPDRLPDVPAQAPDQPEVERIALEQRIDLQQVRSQVQALAANLGLTRTTRWINVLELGPARVLEGQRGDTYKKGFEIAFEVPLFDWGGARIARAEAVYRQALDVTAQMVVEARSEVREAYLRYRLAHDMARHYRDEVVPLKKRISDENLLRYNGMLIGVFELLADARSQIISVSGAIEAQRDFWLAQADLEMAMIGKPNLSRAISAPPSSGGSAPAH